MAPKTVSRSKEGSVKYSNIREHIRKQILHGELQPGMKLPPEVKYAKRFNVNKNTIGRALSGLVREGLVIRRTGCGTFVAGHRCPIWPGRHLRIGVLWKYTVSPERIMASLAGAITRGVLNRWDAHADPQYTHLPRKRWCKATWHAPNVGVTITCLCPAWSNVQHYPPLDPIRSGDFDGLISLGINEEAWLNKLLGTGIPTVLVDYPNDAFSDRADLVYFDPLSGYRAAVATLIKKGLRRIHYVGSMVATSPQKAEMTSEEYQSYMKIPYRIEPDSLLREAAFRVGMAEHQCPVSESWIHRPNFGKENVANRLLTLPPDQQPEAVVCADIYQANEIMQTFADNGKHVIAAGAALKSYAGPAWSLLVDPLEMGHVAASLILARLQQPQSKPIRHGVPIRLQPTEHLAASEHRIP